MADLRRTQRQVREREAGRAGDVQRQHEEDQRDMADLRRTQRQVRERENSFIFIRKSSPSSLACPVIWGRLV